MGRVGQIVAETITWALNSNLRFTVNNYSRGHRRVFYSASDLFTSGRIRHFVNFNCLLKHFTGGGRYERQLYCAGGCIGTWSNVSSTRLRLAGRKRDTVISSLRPATKYHVRLFAENDIGVSQPSTVLRATTTEEGNDSLQWWQDVPDSLKRGFQSALKAV